MTIKIWRKTAEAQLAAVGLASASRESQLLLSHVLQRDTAFLLAHDEAPLTLSQLKLADELLHRRLQHEPLAYITGHKEFFGFDFMVNRHVLIPRWESETLVEAALEWLGQQAGPVKVVEIGTGSGAISITLAKRFPSHHYTATDLSPEVLTIARANAKHHRATIHFIAGNLGEPLVSQTFGLVVANLPYIPSPLLKTLDPTVTYYEPHLALDGGEDGLNPYRHFMPQAQSLLAPGGLLLCEHDYDQAAAMRDLAAKHFPSATIATLQDGLHHDRVLSCLMPA